jgi:CRP-like cAMP-binding protein
MTVLASAYLFRGLAEPTMEEIGRFATEEYHAQNSFLFRAGAPAVHLYILKEGRVRLSIARAGTWLTSSTVKARRLDGRAWPATAYIYFRRSAYSP